MTLLRASILGGLLALSSATAAHPDQIVGTWAAGSGDTKIEVSKCGAAYCGIIAAMRNPRNDEKNEDASQRGRPLVGAQILNGFKFNGTGWTGGKLYAPERGKTVDAHLALDGDDRLDIKVSMGIMKRTVTWKRVK